MSTLAPRDYYRTSQFAVSAPARWVSEDRIEVVECPSFPGRSPDKRYVAQRLNGGPCAWAATKEEAAAAVRGAGA